MVRGTGDPSANSSTWINVTAEPTKRDFSDKVASAGGKPPNLNTDAADEKYTVNANHADFSTMMNTKTATGETIEQRLVDKEKTTGPSQPRTSSGECQQFNDGSCKPY